MENRTSKKPAPNQFSLKALILGMKTHVQNEPVPNRHRTREANQNDKKYLPSGSLGIIKKYQYQNQKSSTDNPCFLTFHDDAEQAYQKELEGLSCFRLVQCMDGCKDYEGGFHFCRHVNMLMRKKSRQRSAEGAA